MKGRIQISLDLRPPGLDESTFSRINFELWLKCLEFAKRLGELRSPLTRTAFHTNRISHEPPLTEPPLTEPMTKRLHDFISDPEIPESRLPFCQPHCVSCPYEHL